MKKWMLIPMIGAALCGALAALPQARGQNGGAAGRNGKSAPKIAVVDMGQILAHYKRAEELLEEVKASGDANNERLKELFGKGQDLMKTLRDGTIDPETREFREREMKVFQLESYVKSYKASAQKELQLQGVQASLAVYNDIQEALKVFCANNGFTIILRADREASSTPDPQNIGRILSQDVIFSRRQEDITIPLLAHLNAQYQPPAQPAPASKPPTSKSASPSSPKSNPR